MPKLIPQLEWCIVRLGDDHNWWVEEISDPVHWDVDGLSILDPRQAAHVIELLEPVREYGFEPEMLERAFFAFRIDKDLGDGRVRLARAKDSLLDADDPLFALPDVLDEATGPYADFLDHIIRCRIRMLNDLIEFEQKLTLDEVEEEIREDENNTFIEGRAVHLFDEIVRALDYIPAGYELDRDEEDKPDEDDLIDLGDHEVSGEEDLDEDETMRWDEDEGSGEEEAADNKTPLEAQDFDLDEEDEDDLEDEDEDEDEDELEDDLVEDDEDEDEETSKRRKNSGQRD